MVFQPGLWNELQTKRDKLLSLHEEFDADRTMTSSGGDRTIESKMTVDIAGVRCREKIVTGSSTRVRIFDGENLFTLEEGDDEYIKPKRNAKDDAPLPALYVLHDADWTKAEDVERRPCTIGRLEHRCVILDAPLKSWIRGNSDRTRTRMLQGSEQAMVDLETGILLSARKTELIQNERLSYRSQTVYKLVRIGYGQPAAAGLFQVPEHAREVKSFPVWDVARIRKQLAGRTAPDLTLTDLAGKSLTLSSFKGKTVLLDFTRRMDRHSRT